MLKFILNLLFLIFLMGVFLSSHVEAEEAKKEEPVKTPVSMLRAIEQRNTELDEKAKQLELKNYRLRILEQEVSENLKKTKGLRDEMAKIRAAQKAADDKREADAKAAEAKKIADAKAAEAKKMADAKAAAKAAEAKKMADAKAFAVRQEIEKKTALVIDKSTEEERALARKMAEEEDELLRKKEEERRALQAQQFAKLAKIYETMPPEDSALRLQNMKNEFALAILPLMKEKKAAKVLAAMDPIVAARYTEQMGMREMSPTGNPFEKKKKR
jgi:flagellar motility protein MotE (MotC chaperone)